MQCQNPRDNEHIAACAEVSKLFGKLWVATRLRVFMRAYDGQFIIKAYLFVLCALAFFAPDHFQTCRNEGLTQLFLSTSCRALPHSSLRPRGFGD